MKKHQFLFEELVKRDFKQKYKRTVLGMGWSILSPLLTLLVLQLVFGFYFGRTIPHYTIYLFCGNLLFAYYKESTTSGMNSLMSNAAIFSKINVPKDYPDFTGMRQPILKFFEKIKASIGENLYWPGALPN